MIIARELLRGRRIDAMDEIGMDLAHDDRMETLRCGKSQEIRLAPAGVPEAVDKPRDSGEPRHDEVGTFADGHGS